MLRPQSVCLALCLCVTNMQVFAAAPEKPAPGARPGTKPEDAEARFAQARSLSKLNQTAEAIKAYTELAHDFPGLAEPENNLGVLYAAQGDYIKARDALEAARIREPNYAKVHANLGDVQLALARESFLKAIDLDAGNVELRAKLWLLDNLLSKEIKETAAKPADQNPESVAVAAASPAAAPVAAAAPVPAGAAEVQKAVMSTVQSWAKAWAQQDLGAYFSTYADDFKPENQLSRADWEKQRSERIKAAKHVGLQLADAKLTLRSADSASLSFTQKLETSGTVKETAKTLDLRQTPSGWKIAREYAR